MSNVMLSPQLIAQLETDYPIGRLQAVAALAGGEWNRVFQLQCEHGTFVLRVSHPTTSAADLTYTHAVMGFMHRRLPAVPAPLATDEGATYFRHEDRLVTLLPLRPGHMLDRANDAECMGAAKMLAHLHRAGLAYPTLHARPNYPPLGELDWAHNRIWRWAEVESLLFQQADALLKRERDAAKRASAEQVFARRSLIVQEHTRCRDWVAALHRSGCPLVFGMMQGDYWRNNLLVQDGEISAVLDWDDCQPEWLVYELARAMWEFCKDSSKQTLDRPKALRFLQAYQAANGPVPAAEFDLLIPFICCVRVIEILFSLQQAQHTGLDEQLLYHLLALENLRGFVLS